MTLQAYALMASADLDETGLNMPVLMSDDRLNQLSSGNSALVFDAESSRIIWQSASTSSQFVMPMLDELVLGQAQFKRFSKEMVSEPDVSQVSRYWFGLSYLVEWQDEAGDVHPYVFFVTETATAFDQQLSSYRQALFFSLALACGVLIVVQLLILRWGLKPLSQVSEDLNRVQSGQAQALEGEYPQELKRLTASINDLIQHESRQREKHRYALADLAHSLKNPVAVLSGAVASIRKHGVSNLSDSSPSSLLPQNTALKNTPPHTVVADIEEQCQRIDQIVSYQLTRAVAESTGPFMQKVRLKPMLEKIERAILKVYQDKHLDIEIDVSEAISIAGDEGDLMELLGNLIDNACKYGKHRVKVQVSQQSEQSNLVVEDDGPGISPEQRKVLMQRGRRADTSLPGQGIGLAVVADIVQSYHGQIALEQSDLGGLKVSVTL